MMDGEGAEDCATWQCDQCGRKLASVENLERHLQTHIVEKPYECGFCDVRCSQRSVLDSHLFLVHAAEKPFECEVCGLRYPRRSLLNQHRYKHTGEKPHECDHCGEKFADRGRLARHVAVHTAEYECKVCGATFSERNGLTRHVATHVPKKPHKSNVCGGRVPQRESLTRDSSHTAEKPYTCEVCGGGFAQKKNLTRHLIHTTEKRNECESCGGKFADRHGLTRHLPTTHSPEKSYECFACLKKYGSSASLRKHVRKAHVQSKVIPKSEESPRTTSAAAALQADCKQEEGLCEDDEGAEDPTRTTKKPMECLVWPRTTAAAAALLAGVKQEGGLSEDDEGSEECLVITEKPFECLVCGETSSDTTALREHVWRTHIADAQTQCPPPVSSGPPGSSRPSPGVVDDVGRSSAGREGRGTPVRGLEATRSILQRDASLELLGPDHLDAVSVVESFVQQEAAFQQQQCVYFEQRGPGHRDGQGRSVARHLFAEDEEEEVAVVSPCPGGCSSLQPCAPASLQPFGWDFTTMVSVLEDILSYAYND